MLLIIANMVSMMIEHEGQKDKLTAILKYINYVFVAVFTGEAAIKVRKIKYMKRFYPNIFLIDQFNFLVKLHFLSFYKSLNLLCSTSFFNFQTFTIIFNLFQLFALRHHYFTNPWNVFDFIVVILSIFGTAFGSLIEKYFVQVN